MKKSLRILSAAALLAAVPAAYAGGEACAASSKTTKAGTACSATAVAAKSDSCCPSAKAQQVVLKVKESGCTSATAGFSMAVAKLDGVKAVDTCGQSHMTKVSYDGSKVCADKIVAALKGAGYHIEAQQVTLAVAGMAKDACTDKLSKAFTAVQGVSNANVCSVGGHAVVEFNPDQVSVDKLIAAAGAAGYQTSVEAAN